MGFKMAKKVQTKTINIKEEERNIYNLDCTFGTNENDIVLQCHEKGYTIRQIADITNISKSKVFRIIKANSQNIMPSKTINIEGNNTINKEENMIPKTIEVEVIPKNVERKKKPYITPTIEVRENKHIIAV